MVDHRRGAQTVFEIHVHWVWITKDRQPVLSGEAGVRVRDLIRDIGAQHGVNIRKGQVAKDHVHRFASIPPRVTISRLLQRRKGKSAHHLMAEFLHIKKQFWGRRLWARGEFGCSLGNVTGEVIAECIADQNTGQAEDVREDG